MVGIGGRRAVKGIRRAPALTATIAMTLAVGFGANGVLLGLVGQLMFQLPSGVPEPDQLHLIPTATNLLEYERVLELGVWGSVQGKQAVAAVSRVSASASLIGADVEVIVECATPSYARVLLAAPEAGRWFVGDDEPHALVSRRLAALLGEAATGALGTFVLLDGRSFEVIGVMPEGFTGYALDPVDLWIPIRSAPATCSFSGEDLTRVADSAWLSVVARVDAAAAVAVTRSLDASWSWESKREDSRRSAEPHLVGLYASGFSRMFGLARTAAWLFGASALVLACAVANSVLLARLIASRRELEFAVVTQLGAPKSTVWRALVAEAGAAAALCGSLTAGVSLVLRTYVYQALDQGPTVDRAIVGMTVLGATLAFFLIAFGANARQYSRADVSMLRVGRTASARTRGAWVVGGIQVAFAATFLVLVGLLSRTLDSIARDIGYSVDDIVVVRVDLGSTVPQSEQETAWLTNMATLISSAPVIDSTAIIDGPIPGLNGPTNLRQIRRLGSDQRTVAVTTVISGDFWRTLGIELDEWTLRDGAAAAATTRGVVIDSALALELWQSTSAPLGKCLLIASVDECWTVVGVSGHRHQVSVRAGLPEVYVRADARAGADIPVARHRLVVARVGAGGSLALGLDVAASVVRALDKPPGVVMSVHPMQDLVGRELRGVRMALGMFGVFAILALVLSGVGVFAALSAAVRNSRREIAIRMILGAAPVRAIRPVWGRSAVAVSTGAGAGLLGGVLCGSTLRNLLYGVQPLDPWSLIAAVAVLGLVAAVSALVPLGRVSHANTRDLVN